MSRSSRLLAVLVVLLVASLGGVKAATGAPTELFLSEYIEGTSNNKAVEIFNGTGTAIDLGANVYNVQYYFNGSGTAGLTINLVGTVADGDVFVLAHAMAHPDILAEADQTNGAGWYNGDDAVVLRKGTTILDVIGQVGFDPGTEWGTGLTSTADNTLRRKSTIQAGDPDGSNAFDPAVEWDGFATDTFDGLGEHSIDEGDAAPAVAATDPASGESNVALDANVEITFSEPVDVTGSWYSLNCTTSGAHTATVSGGPITFTLDPDADFVQSETCTATVVAAQVTDQDTDDPPDNMAGDHIWNFTTETAPVRIHEIQGAAHLSPLSGQAVSDVPGIVTALRSSGGAGFYLQDPSPDSDIATSEGIFVFTNSAPSVSVGDSVEVSGNVAEFRPGGSGSTNLTTTEITSPTITVLSSGNPLPPPTVIGAAGRTPPTEVIDDDATGSVETSGSFDAATDGIDFYESLEAMLVRVTDATVVGPTAFGEIPVLADDGAGAGVRTARGGIVIRANDFNPERMFFDDVLNATPLVSVGDSFPGAVDAVVDYSFGNFKLQVLTPLAPVAGGLQREQTADPENRETAIGTFNVENLDPGDSTFARLAELIVDNLRSPDLVGIEEIQDNNGPTNDSVVDASVTWNMLIQAIQDEGGPVYEYRQIDPVDDQDGGEPGGNIRVGFLFRTDRRLSFVDRPGGNATTPTTVLATAAGPQLSFSPGRIDPQDPAFNNSRKPLVGEFIVRNKKVFAIVNHFNSKGGDQPLFGRFQPPSRPSEVQRHQQAQIVNDFVDELLAVNPNANVVVLGDLNDFEFSQTLDILKGGVLENLVDTLPQPERYSYVFEGNSQVLDQILVSDYVFERFPIRYDVVHINSEFVDQDSDHEASIARVTFTGP